MKALKDLTADEGAVELERLRKLTETYLPEGTDFLLVVFVDGFKHLACLRPRKGEDSAILLDTIQVGLSDTHSAFAVRPKRDGV